MPFFNNQPHNEPKFGAIIFANDCIFQGSMRRAWQTAVCSACFKIYIQSTLASFENDLSANKQKYGHHECVVPENIHTPSWKELDIPKGRGVKEKTKFPEFA